MQKQHASETSRAPVDMTDVRFAWRGNKNFGISIKKFTLQPGERLLLIGPSGTGKSTFLSLLTGIVNPAEGRISILGQDITKLSAASKDRFRAQHFGIIFQMFNLLPYASILDNVMLPLSFSKVRAARADRGEGAKAEARRLLAELGLEPSLIEGSHSAAMLSVGQQQRVAAARALIGAPEIVVADEPTSSLDRNRQQAFLELLFRELERAEASLIMVSHDETLAPLFDRVEALSDIATITRGQS